jgi:hypothetical protein
MTMPEQSIADIGEKLTAAGRLKYRPLCVYGSDKAPEGAVKTSSIDRCIAKVILKMAADDGVPTITISGEDEDCCGGGRTWLGFVPMNPMLKYFVTTGNKDFRGGAAEHLKATPELFEKSYRALGAITPPGRYIVVRPCADITGDPGVRSILCFGIGEQVRNLAGLAEFTEFDQFSTVVTPGGPTCATFITYPAGMAEKAPKGSVFLGPTDPTSNIWFPPELMAMGIPIKKARQMAESLESSFIGKKPKVAYPERRLELKVP